MCVNSRSRQESRSHAAAGVIAMSAAQRRHLMCLLLAVVLAAAMMGKLPAAYAGTTRGQRAAIAEAARRVQVIR